MSEIANVENRSLWFQRSCNLLGFYHQTLRVGIVNQEACMRELPSCHHSGCNPACQKNTLQFQVIPLQLPRMTDLQGLFPSLKRASAGTLCS